MLRSTFYSFTTALRGLNTAQKQLDITGNNISNVGTTGYTRQRADVYSAAPAGYGDKYGSRPSTLVGQGSVIGSISQCRDQFLDVRFRRESATLGEEQAKLNSMDDISLVFDEIEKSALMTSFTDFISKLNSLAGNANSSEFDSIARNSASALVKQFNQYATQLSNIREEKEYNLKDVTCSAINDLLSGIADINDSIRKVQSTGGPALELKDERNLLLDQLSSYVKLDVQYSPKELAGGIVVDDVSINMVGADGSKQPLIYNDTAATFNVQTPGDDGTDKAVVTIDNSAIPAVAAQRSINNLLNTIFRGNNSLQSINKELAKLYPGDSTQVPPIPPLTYEGLPAKITELTDSIESTGGLNEQITAANTAVSDARAALKAKLADSTATEAEITVLRQAVTDAVTSQSTLVKQRNTALESKTLLSKYNSIATTAANNVSVCDTALKAQLAAKGVTANLVYGTAGDYTTGYYNFTDSSGNPVLDSDGNEIVWKVGSSCTTVTRDDLTKIGMTFEDHFDAETFASPGALKGELEMLNNKGVFDYNSTQVRGIGYYESMLDSLAEKFATVLNQLNDKTSTTDKEYLFQTSDGSSTFTAKNLRLSDDWLNGKYGITQTQNASAGSGDGTGQSDNILLMISTITSKLNYTTGSIGNKDINGNYLKTDAGGVTTIAANGRDADGNYTLNGVPVANEDMIDYVYDSVTGTYKLDANTVTEDAANPGTYLDSSGTLVANGKDNEGNYTMTTTDAATGVKTVTLVANSNGILYKTDAAGQPQKDSDGNYILDGTQSNLDHREGSFLFTGSFSEFLSNLSTVIGNDVSSTNNLAANHEAILDDIVDARDAISSVSLDEEGVNIMQYQKAYNAAARLMTSLDEMVERIISQMGTAGR
ncbi:FlgK family flagellar hook-associated protein [Aminipila luticellarii]|uniref:Flagellar hook-associated protein 1 n=1 Tax=Aminipila luticellarii TaxID=2507160 RepID=A0A410PYX1_9FIRM|nr:flagellar basal body protein [Aminipila luticellarii]QAT44050.1 hypothetical protein EQM06_01570 [Aminipila luticellarii]